MNWYKFPESRFPFELALLFQFALFLPLYEAPKNLLWLGYTVTWLWNRWHSKEWGGPWRYWDTLILFWIASGFVVAYFAGTHHSEWRGANDILRYGSIFWCIRRSDYTREDFSRLAELLLVSCVIGVAWGLWDCHGSGQRGGIELNSVGANNHSAAYIGICIGLLLSWILARTGDKSPVNRAKLLLIMIFLLGALIDGASRGTLGALVLVPILLGMGWRQHRRRQVIFYIASFYLIYLVIAAAVGFAGLSDGNSVIARKWGSVEWKISDKATGMPARTAVVGKSKNDGVIALPDSDKTTAKNAESVESKKASKEVGVEARPVVIGQSREDGGITISHRDTIWRRALIGWEAYPWFGLGMDNFNQISDDMVRQRVEAEGKSYRREDYIGANHAHNLYLNTLAERGLFGFLIFGTVLISWVATLWRYRPAADASDTEWMFWGGSLSAWTIISFAGIFNTTLHHEIALLALILFGGWQSLALTHKHGNRKQSD